MEQISIHEFKLKKLKKQYGSKLRCYKQSDVEELLSMWNDLHYLTELSTRTRLVPSNDEFLNKKAIPHYNEWVKKLQIKYPNIKEFHYFKTIIK